MNFHKNRDRYRRSWSLWSPESQPATRYRIGVDRGVADLRGSSRQPPAALSLVKSVPLWTNCDRSFNGSRSFGGGTPAVLSDCNRSNIAPARHMVVRHYLPGGGFYPSNSSTPVWSGNRREGEKYQSLIDFSCRADCFRLSVVVVVGGVWFWLVESRFPPNLDQQQHAGARDVEISVFGGTNLDENLTICNKNRTDSNAIVTFLRG